MPWYRDPTDHNSERIVSSWNPSGKHLTVTVGGVWPYIARSASGVIGGTDLKIVNLLAQKFNFSVSLYPINTFKDYFATVRSPPYS